MPDIRARAKEILDLHGFTTPTATKPLNTMTISEKLGMIAACDSFVRWYARELGIRNIESFFDLRKSLIHSNKRHAWVHSTATRRPKSGDILKHRIFHTDVVIGFEGDVLLRAVGKQSGHLQQKAGGSNEFDVLVQVQEHRPYDYTSFDGWLDLDLYLDPKA